MEDIKHAFYQFKNLDGFTQKSKKQVEGVLYEPTNHLYAMCQSIGVKYKKRFIFCAVWLWKEWMWQEQTQLKVDMAT